MKLDFLANLPKPSQSARIISIILAIGFLAIGVSEVISPSRWDASFGVSLIDEGGLLFVRAVGARNIALSLIAIFAAVAGMRAVLVTFFVVMGMVSAMELYIVTTAVGTTSAPKYVILALLMLGIALWVALSKSRAGKQTTKREK